MTHNGHQVSAEYAEAQKRFHDDQQRRFEVVCEDEEALHAAAYREASKKLLPILDAAVIFIITARNPILAAWQVAYGMGTACSTEMSEDEKGRELGVVRATISKGAQAFRRSVHLPPPLAAKSAASTASYHHARVRQLS